MSEKVSKSFFTHTINKKHKNISHNENHLCAMRVKVRLDKGLFCSVLHTMYIVQHIYGFNFNFKNPRG